MQQIKKMLDFFGSLYQCWEDILLRFVHGICKADYMQRSYTALGGGESTKRSYGDRSNLEFSMAANRKDGQCAGKFGEL